MENCLLSDNHNKVTDMYKINLEVAVRAKLINQLIDREISC